jgi:outer membrane phospholipase A
VLLLDEPTNNYSTFETLRASDLLLQQATYEKQQKTLAHMHDFVERFRYKASKARQAQSRLKANQMSIPLTDRWRISAVNVGAVHESNGLGNKQERSWNKAYVEAIASADHWMVSLKPWYVFRDATYQKFNPNMATYLGYGEITLAGKFAKQVFTLQTYNLIEHGGNYAIGLITYSFPLTTYLNGFVQVFSGYGQSLIEYNHRTNSIGVGIALSNLI